MRGYVVGIDEKEWNADTKALAACLEALLTLVRDQAGPAAAPAANDRQLPGSESGSRNPASQEIARGSGPE